MFDHSQLATNVFELVESYAKRSVRRWCIWFHQAIECPTAVLADGRGNGEAIGNYEVLQVSHTF